MTDLAQRIIDTPRHKVFDLAIAELRDGRTQRDLLGAVFLAGVQEIEPRPVGFALHAVMMTASVQYLTGQVGTGSRLLGTFFNLDDFKNSQERDRRDGDWRLGPTRGAGYQNADETLHAFTSAMENWDEEPADRAVADLVDCMSRDELFEFLWIYGARDFRDIGHKMIFTSQVYRGLELVGWRRSEPALRSLVYGLLSGGPGRTNADFKPNRERARALRDGWASGKLDHNASILFLKRLRSCSSQEASAEVVRLLQSGVAPDSVWDGLRLVASEMVLREPSLLPVHAVTALNAFHVAYMTTKVDVTRRILLLQAASWQPLFRDALAQRVGLSMDGPGIDRHPSPPALSVAARRERSIAVFQKAQETHQYKYMAAMLEEGDFAHPRWASQIHGAGNDYLPGPETPDNDLYQRVVRELQKLHG